jgi:hypothetical protein
LSLWLIGKVLKEQLLVARLQTSLHLNLCLQSRQTIEEWIFVNVVFLRLHVHVHAILEHYCDIPAQRATETGLGTQLIHNIHTYNHYIHVHTCACMYMCNYRVV